MANSKWIRAIFLKFFIKFPMLIQSMEKKYIYHKDIILHSILKLLVNNSSKTLTNSSETLKVSLE